jgi:HK97 family phage portal protein
MKFVPHWLQRKAARIIVKAAGMPVVSPWVRYSFLEPTFTRLTRDGYQKNSALFACVSALTFAFPEPPLLITQDGEPLLQNPLRRLLTNPNPLMGEAELMMYTMEYMALGGNAYWYKVRSGAGRVVELWPYHVGHILPVPGGDNWIARYEFDSGDGIKRPIPTEDIIHFKWPAIDPKQPWMAQPPILAAARETDTDSEATHYLYALLKNDAVPRTAIEYPPEADITRQEELRIKEQWRERYGGDNRGDVAILTGGGKINRLSLNLQELAFEALSTIPETRIAAALRVPPIVAGLNAGLQRSTFANYGEARKAFTQDTLVPLWRLVESELQADLVPEFDQRLTIAYDTGQVEALQENEAERRAFLLGEFQAGALTLNEYRRLRGYADTDQGDVFYLPNTITITSATPEEATPNEALPEIFAYHIDNGIVTRNEVRERLGLPPEDASQDEQLRRLQSALVIVQSAVMVGIPLSTALRLVGMDGNLSGVDSDPDPEQRTLPTAPERKTLPLAIKQVSIVRRERIAGRIEQRALAYLSGEYSRAAAWIQENAPEQEQRSVPAPDLLTPRHETNGHHHDHALLLLPEAKQDLPPWASEIPVDDGSEITGWIRGFHVDLMELAFGDAADTLGMDLLFDVENENVQEVLGELAQLVSRVADTTRDDIAALVGISAQEGWSIDDLAAEVLKLNEIQTTNRARLIARTETARAYSEGSLLGYADGGVEETEWLVTDPCPICEPLAGRTAPIGAEFAPGIRVPGDPHPGCKCALAPVVTV